MSIPEASQQYAFCRHYSKPSVAAVALKSADFLKTCGFCYLHPLLFWKPC